MASIPELFITHTSIFEQSVYVVRPVLIITSPVEFFKATAGAKHDLIQLPSEDNPNSGKESGTFVAVSDPPSDIDDELL